VEQEDEEPQALTVVVVEAGQAQIPVVQHRQPIRVLPEELERLQQPLGVVEQEQSELMQLVALVAMVVKAIFLTLPEHLRNGQVAEVAQVHLVAQGEQGAVCQPGIVKTHQLIPVAAGVEQMDL
jgi:hypothetical protein